MSFQKEVYERLSSIDCSDMVEIKGSGNFKLSYLSWASAWQVLMENYPESTFFFNPPQELAGGTVEIWCSVIIKEGDGAWEQSMWLPVMDHKNQPVTNPHARQINDTRMRCLVKCLALFGLGLYIYRGEDVPDASKETAVNRQTGRQPESVAKTAEEPGFDPETVNHLANVLPFMLEASEEDRFVEEWRRQDKPTQIAVWQRLDSKVRAAAKIVLDAHSDNEAAKEEMQ